VAAPATITVRIKASASVGSISGNITNASAGATSKDVAVSGTVNAIPTPTITVNATWLLNCAGAWALPVAARFGDTAPLTAIHPGMAVTEPVPRFMDVNVGVEGGGIYGRQTARGNCVMGGSRGAATNSLYAVPTARAIGELCDRMATLFPPLAHAHVIRFWSGVEGSLPDHHPVVGASPTTPNLIHAFGFCGAGFQIGPAVGEALAELVHHGRAGVALDAFSITRFASGTPSANPIPSLQGVH